MRSIETKVKNKTGLHARPAAVFSTKAAAYKAQVTLQRLDREGEGVNAKSVINVLSLTVKQGDAVRIVASGEDEEAAVAALKNLIEEGFGEL